MGKSKKNLSEYDSKIFKKSKESEEWNCYLSMVMMNMSDSLLITDNDFKIIYINKQSEVLFGYKLDEIIGKSPSLLNTGLMTEQIQKNIHETASEGEIFIQEALSRRKDGSTFICEFKISSILTEEGFPSIYVGIQRDVTEKRKIVEELRNNNDRFDQITRQNRSIAWEVDEKGLYTYISNAIQDVLGYMADEVVGKMYFYDFFPETVKENLKDEVFEIFQSKELFENYFNTTESKSGENIYMSTNGMPILDEYGILKGYRGFDVDITEKREKQTKIEYLSFHDHLTGLYNRRYVEEMMKRLDIERNLPFAVMVLDVNGLKLINDAFGHEMGDKLLKTVAEIMKSVCRPDDIVGRMGGDEFYILLPKTNEEQAEAIKRKIMEATSEARLSSVIVSLAAGYAVKNEMNQELEIILATADNYMYKEKLKCGKTMRNKTIETVIRNINVIHEQEQIHTERVSKYCEAITRAMNFSEKEILNIKTAGALHDIGKIMIPPELLNRPDKLTVDEFEIIKRHPEIGYQILKSVDEYASIAENVLYHHERWDGTGYPEGLRGNEIPLHSRIIAVADAYEIMTGNYTYGRSKSRHEVQLEFERCSGTNFDPEIVSVFLDEVLWLN
ncbi:MAG: HD domain-containing phosphohydrolase [Proteocatella sp.]